MIVSIQPSLLKGAVQAPASKSSMQRACAAALLRMGVTVLHNPGHSHDDLAALDTIQKLGAQVEDTRDGTLTIRSSGVSPVSGEINCGESGLGVRMFTPIAALSAKPLVINGRGSLVTRPLHFFDEIFPQLGIRIQSNQGHLPLSIQGPLQPVDITVDGSLSSQFLTGLLMAYAAAGAEGKVITVRDLKSKPYIDLTLNVLGQFGWKVTHKAHETFHFEGESAAVAPASSGRHEDAVHSSLHYTVEGDWSGGAFLLVAGAIAGPIEIRGLDQMSAQADKVILEALNDAGALLRIEGDLIHVTPRSLEAFRFDATDCPDLFPPLVALAAYCKGKTTIQGVSRLEHKESNRAATLQQEFGKLGVDIVLEGDFMHIQGGAGVRGGLVTSHNDHRIAMACAVVALRAEGPVTIGQAQAIDKSYTDFYKHLRALGVPVEEAELNPISSTHE